jgi:glycosyltransferase involved in cell wall biosynthesis
MFKKLPIVADHGGLRDIVQHEKNGLKFTPGDEKDLANKIINVIESDVNYKVLTECGRKTYIEQYHPSVFGVKLKELINGYLEK